jgi:DNA-binding MarR family transcriptional regulator
VQGVRSRAGLVRSRYCSLMTEQSGSPAAEAEIARSADAVLTASRALLGVVAVSLAPVLERVSPPQFRALVLLSVLGPTRIGALAQRLGVHQSTFTRTTDRMAEAGLVRRQENPGNRREVIVEATESGLDLVRLVTENRRREIERILAGMTDHERLLFLAGAEAFARAAGEPPIETLAPLGG